MRYWMLVCSLILGAAVGACGEAAELSLPAVFSDHMVLQRDMAVPVFGTAGAGEQITVSFGGQTKTAAAGADGKWLVRLDPLPASAEARALTVKSSGGGQVTIQDVLVGEVWVGSGQSNMAGAPAHYVKDDPVLVDLLNGAPYPLLRLISAKNGGRWQTAEKANLGQFSTLLFCFGQPLQKELGVPVGLIRSAEPATPSGRWLTEEMLKADATCQESIQAYNSTGRGATKKDGGTLNDARSKIGDLYELHVRPVVGYGIRGVFWDQGENGTAVLGVEQDILMGALIAGWRKEWGQPGAAAAGAPGTDFPFICVEKPSGGGCAWDEENPVTRNAEKCEPLPDKVPADGEPVETYIRIMRHPNTGLVITSDLGSGTHPTNKSGYGRRAVDVALGMVYGKAVEYYGPVYESHTVEGASVRVKFTHVGQGLAFRHGEKLQGFAVSGDGKTFQWADAKIDGDTVVVSSDKVPNPTAVRYAWSRKRAWANLFNKDGLPALPFRTDR